MNTDAGTLDGLYTCTGPKVWRAWPRMSPFASVTVASSCTIRPSGRTSTVCVSGSSAGAGTRFVYNWTVCDDGYVCTGARSIDVAAAGTAGGDAFACANSKPCCGSAFGSTNGGRRLCVLLALRPLRPPGPLWQKGFAAVAAPGVAPEGRGAGVGKTPHRRGRIHAWSVMYPAAPPGMGYRPARYRRRGTPRWRH